MSHQGKRPQATSSGCVSGRVCAACARARVCVRVCVRARALVSVVVVVDTGGGGGGGGGVVVVVHQSEYCISDAESMRAEVQDRSPLRPGQSLSAHRIESHRRSIAWITCMRPAATGRCSLIARQKTAEVRCAFHLRCCWLVSLMKRQQMKPFPCFSV